MSEETKNKGIVAVLQKDKPTIEDIPSLLEDVNKKIDAIRGNLPKQPHTTKELREFGKVSDIKTVNRLLEAASVVIAKENAYKEAAKLLLPEGFKVPTFKINGSTPKQWLEDIQARIVVVANKEKLDALAKIKKTLEENLSAEAKLANDLKKIQGILSETEKDEEEDA